MKKFLVGLFAGLALVAGIALATNSSAYFGWNPSTGLEVFHGAQVSGGVSPVIAGSGANCGTLGTVSGGATAGTFVAGAVTTCQVSITFPSAAPNGWLCEFFDLTTPADLQKSGATTTTSCTSSSNTIVSGDTIQFVAIGY